MGLKSAVYCRDFFNCLSIIWNSLPCMLCNSERTLSELSRVSRSCREGWGMRLISCAVDAVGTAEPTWAAAAAASSSAIQDDRHTDRNQIVRQVTKSSFAELWSFCPLVLRWLFLATPMKCAYQLTLNVIFIKLWMWYSWHSGARFSAYCVMSCICVLFLHFDGIHYMQNFCILNWFRNICFFFCIFLMSLEFRLWYLMSAAPYCWAMVAIWIQVRKS